MNHIVAKCNGPSSTWFVLYSSPFLVKYEAIIISTQIISDFINYNTCIHIYKKILAQWYWSINQSINQSLDPSISWWIVNLNHIILINESINQSITWSICQYNPDQSINQSCNPYMELPPSLLIEPIRERIWKLISYWKLHHNWLNKCGHPPGCRLLLSG